MVLLVGNVACLVPPGKPMLGRASFVAKPPGTANARLPTVSLLLFSAAFRQKSLPNAAN